MAKRRMFSLDVVDSDRFLDMPISSQLLYFHLAMRADDDGFVSSPKRIMRSINTNDDDLRMLFVKEYIITFESGILVITHWNQNNSIKKDRYIETIFLDEKSLLELKNKAYQIKDYTNMGRLEPK